MLLKNMIRPLYYFLKEKKVRKFYSLCSRFENTTRNVPYNNLKLNDSELDIVDGPSFIGQFKEIFIDEVYKFRTANSSPIIYDCGANIGSSILYFKKNYPGAVITAFEPDKKIFECALRNVKKNELKDISLINKAVWINDLGVSFESDGADGGAISNIHGNSLVETVRLKDLIAMEKNIDMLKIDIEGAETKVLLDCAENLNRVQNIFIEYHSISNEKQTLSKILEVLEDQGFRYFIEPLTRKKSPLYNTKNSNYMDLQINVFGYRS